MAARWLVVVAGQVDLFHRAGVACQNLYPQKAAAKANHEKRMRLPDLRKSLEHIKKTPGPVGSRPGREHTGGRPMHRIRTLIVSNLPTKIKAGYFYTRI